MGFIFRLPLFFGDEIEDQYCDTLKAILVVCESLLNTPKH